MQAPPEIPVIPVFFKQCGACIVVDEAGGDLMQWAAEHEGDWLASAANPRQSPFAELLISPWKDGKVHFHVERSGEDLSDEHTRHCDFDDIVKKITQFAELLKDAPVCVNTRGKLSVRIAELPRDGLMARALSTGGTSCGVELSLGGGSIDVDDELCTTISFRRPRDRDWVNIVVDFVSDEQLTPGFLASLDSALTAVVDCFVFGRVEAEAPNAHK